MLDAENAGNICYDEIAGIITVASQLDYEEVSSYTLSVSASDNGLPCRVAHTTFTVIVLNVNDNPPRFFHSIYQSDVWENQPAGTSVVQVQASDPDPGKYLHNPDSSKYL